jgi:DnaJ-class molecular chaperone
MPCDYYQVLGVDRSATPEDIKKAYRRKVLTAHPDKAKQPEGQTPAIYTINEAYSVLKDPAKRKGYDASLLFGGASGDSAAFANIIAVVQMVKTYAAMIRVAVTSARSKNGNSTPEDPGASPTPSPRPAPAPEPVRLTLTVSLEDLYAAKIKRLVFRRRRNLKVERHTLYVSLYDYQDSYTFEGQGDEVRPNMYTDVVVSLRILPHPTFKMDRDINRYDLYHEAQLSLFGYYYGTTVIVPGLDGRPIEVVASGFKDPEDLVVAVSGKGLPYYDEEAEAEAGGDGDRYGTLYVFFRLHLKPLPPDVLELDEHPVRDVLMEFL